MTHSTGSGQVVLRDIERYLSATGMTPTMFGKLSVSDPRLVFDLRRGRAPNELTARRVRHFILKNGGEA